MLPRPLLLLAPLLFLAAASPPPAPAVDLPLAARLPNGGGFCAWSAISSAAIVNRVDRLVSVYVDRVRTARANGFNQDIGYDPTIRAELDRRQVRYEMRDQWSFDRSLLEKYTETHGVVVALKEGNPHSVGCHMVYVTRYDRDPAGQVEFYDSSKPNDAQGRPKLWKCGRDWYDRWWLGNSVVILPDDPGEPVGPSEIVLVKNGRQQQGQPSQVQSPQPASSTAAGDKADEVQPGQIQPGQLVDGSLAPPK